MSNTPIPTQVTRLNQEVYKQIENKFSRPMVTSNTSEIEAGYQLGVQAVLQYLRHNIVVDEQ